MDAHRTEQGLAGRLAPEVLEGLGALARVSRALAGTGSLSVLASRALAEMRDAMRLELAALYPPDGDGRLVLQRYVTAAAGAATVSARAELSFDEEAWRLAVASGAPIVLREAASWLVDNPFEPPAENWVILPLAGGERDMVAS